MGASDTCIIVDSACDLPSSYIKQNNIAILPSIIRIGKQSFIDRRNEDETIAICRKGLNGERFDTEITAYNIDQISETIASRVATRYEKALVLTVTSHVSEMFENVSDCLRTHQHLFREARRNSGRDEYFTIRALDTEALFSGQAIIAHEAVRLTKNSELPLNKLTNHLRALSQQVYTHIIPRQMHPQFEKRFIANESRPRGIGSRFSRLLEKTPIIRAHCGDTRTIMKAPDFDHALKLLLEHVMRQIKQGVEPKLLCISYAGELRAIRNKSMYRQFVKFADHYEIEIMLSVMSTTAAVNLGPGSFSLAFAAAEFV